MRTNPSSCDCTEIRTHVPTSEGFRCCQLNHRGDQHCNFLFIYYFNRNHTFLKHRFFRFLFPSDSQIRQVTWIFEEKVNFRQFGKSIGNRGGERKRAQLSSLKSYPYSSRPVSRNRWLCEAAFEVLIIRAAVLNVPNFTFQIAEFLDPKIRNPSGHCKRVWRGLPKISRAELQVVSYTAAVSNERL